MSFLLDAWRIIKAVPEAAGVAIEAGKAVGRLVKSLRRMPKPRVPPREESMPLSHLDSEIQRRASHVPDWQKCCPFARSAGLHGEDCYDQGRPNCPFRETVTNFRPIQDPQGNVIATTTGELSFSGCSDCLTNFRYGDGPCMLHAVSSPRAVTERPRTILPPKRER